MRRRLEASGGIAVAFAIVSACAGPEAGGAGSFTRTDSAGFTIATNTADVSSLRPVFTVNPQPRLRIGVEDGPQELMFSRVAGAIRLDDGRIAVGNGQPMEIRIFDASGQFVTRAGQEGPGPEEFRALRSLIAGRGDTLMALDLPRLRLLRFTAAGKFVGASSAPTDSLEPRLFGMRRAEGTQEYFGNGSFIVSAEPPAGTNWDQLPTGELFRTSTSVVWISADASRSVMLGTFGGIEQMYIDVGGGRRTAEIPPNSRRSLHALGGRGRRFCNAGNDVPEIRCIDDDGRGLILRWAQDSVPTSRETIDRWRSQARETTASSRRAAPEARERVIAGMIIPSTVPPIGALIVDADKRILVSGPDLAAPDSLVRYRVFSAEGELLGYVDVPRVSIRELGTDYLLGVARNDDGVEFVVMHDAKRAR